MTENINEMRRWLKEKDPKYGGQPGWAKKVDSWPRMRVYAVYMSRQESIKKAENQKKIDRKYHQIEMSDLFDMTKKEEFKETYHQIEMSEIFDMSTK